MQAKRQLQLYFNWLLPCMVVCVLQCTVILVCKNMQFHVAAITFSQSDHVTVLQGPLGQGCKAQVKTKQKQYDVAAQKHARQFGKALGLTASDLLWGLGTVGIAVLSLICHHGDLLSLHAYLAG